MNGTELLAEFRDNRSETAFGELVRRYTNLVYSVAKRRLGNDSLAQETTQLVFIRLAKTVPKLQGDNELAAWLHRTTVHISIDLWRSESRRRAREANAAVMHAEPDEAVAWNNRGWPSVWIIDSRCIIRHRDGYDRQVVQALLRE